MALSVHVLRPEQVPVSTYDDIYYSWEAQAYSEEKGHRMLATEALQHEQLRILHSELTARCSELDCFFGLLVKACESTLRLHVGPSVLLDGLSEELAFVTQQVAQLKPVLDEMELPPRVLSSIADEEDADDLWECMVDEFSNVEQMVDALRKQSELLQEWVQQQKAYVRYLTPLCSTQLVARLMSALLCQHGLSAPVVHNDIMRTLQRHLSAARQQSRRGVAPTAATQSTPTEAPVTVVWPGTVYLLAWEEPSQISAITAYVPHRNNPMTATHAAPQQGGVAGLLCLPAAANGGPQIHKQTNGSRKTRLGWIRGAFRGASRVVVVAAASILLGSAGLQAIKYTTKAARRRT